MDHYKKVFTKVLSEATDGEVWDSSFENPAAADEFNTAPMPAGVTDGQIEKAKSWIKRLESFADWVNGTEIDSLNKQFIALDREGGIFEGISNHSKRLISIAEDLASLEETIKGYILTADKREQEANKDVANGNQRAR